MKIPQKMEDEEQISWGRQFIIACELFPKKDEEGELQEVECIAIPEVIDLTGAKRKREE